MKKITMLWTVLLLAVMSASFCLAGCGSSESGTGEEAAWPAMDELQAMEASDVTAISYQRGTEAGVTGDELTDATVIEDVFLRLKNVSILAATDAGVDDDSLDLTLTSSDKSLKFSFEGDILLLEDGGRYEVQGLNSLKKYLDGLAAAEDGTGQAKAGGNSSADFDILDGLQIEENGSICYIYGNDFLLTMPSNDKWDITQDSRDAFTIYLKAARDSGYEGDLVTIQAYDLEDRSYEQLPHYQVAGTGRNVNKRFVAIYPTDVRWDGNDAGQTADYRELSDYLNKIGEGAVNSPFQTADSDPAPAE